MIRRSSWTIFIFFVLLLLPIWLLGQDTLHHKKKIITMVDSLLIDRDINHWSVRAITNFKDYNFKIRNDQSTISYNPTNRFGVGVGIASAKFLLDIMFNIKSNREEATKRFDLQTGMRIKQELLLLHIQNYQGFNATNTSIDDPGQFRGDIKTRSTALSYTHIFKSGVKTLHTLYSGVITDSKSIGTFLGGAYASYHQVLADSSIIPESSRELFNEQAQIIRMDKIAIGISGGYAYIWSLPNNFFALIDVTPGIGLNFKNIETETGTYHSSELGELYLYANLALGYNGPDFYVELRDENVWNFSSLEHGNMGSMNSTKLSLTFGWKIRKAVR